MAEVIRMPKMSDTMTEGVIVEWHKKVGDDVKPGDILAEVETDKSTMELENYVKGTLLHIGIEKGKAVPVDAVIAVVGKQGEDFSSLIAGGDAQAAQPAPGTKETPAKNTPKQETTTERTDSKSASPAPAVSSSTSTDTKGATTNGRIKASPLAKKIASEKGIDIRSVSGSGDLGRIVKRDVENLSAGRPGMMAAAVVAEESYDEVQVSQMRKAIARRLVESKNAAPHFYLTMSVNMDKAMEARKAINEMSPVKVSLNDLVIKAVASALRMHPRVNSSWLGDTIRMNHHIHIGVAVAIEDGLIVPVVKFADNKTVSQVAAEVKELAYKAKNKKLQPAEYEGNTFTISNLGMFGIDEFTAIINPPDSCILAVGAAKETAVAEGGKISIAHVMKVTLSCDHRSVDGASGAAFLQLLKEMLENPYRFLLQV